MPLMEESNITTLGKTLPICLLSFSNLLECFLSQKIAAHIPKNGKGLSLKMSKQANVPPSVPISPSPASFPKASHTGHFLSLVSPACCYRASMVCGKIGKSGNQLVLGTQEMGRKQSLKKMRGYTETRKS